MSIEVSLKQKLFGNKTMPLEVILGDNLHYGNFLDGQLIPGKLGKSEFVAYNPDKIGRGISVVWNKAEKKNITLRISHPSTAQELTDFYAAVERMAKYWDAKLVVDSNKTSLETFMAGFDDMVEFNDKTLKKFSQEILDEESKASTFYCTMWPLVVGKEEAAMFLSNADSYAQWLHEKQSVDVYFPTPSFYMGEGGIFATYLLMNDLPTVFPYNPEVPMGAIDPATGKTLVCNQWTVSLRIAGKLDSLCEMDYSKFLSIIPEDKKTKFDGTHFVLSSLSEEELIALSDQ